MSAGLRRMFMGVPKKQLAALLAFMSLSSLTDGISFMLLVPLLGLLQGGTPGQGWIREVVLATQRWGVEPTLGVFLLVFVLLMGLRSGVQFWREVLGARLQHQWVDRYRKDIFASLLHAEWAWLVAGRRSDRANTLLTEVSRVGVGLGFAMSLLSTLISMTAYIAVAALLSWQITVLALVLGGVALFGLGGQRRKALRLGDQLGIANRGLQGRIEESLGGIKLAKILGAEKRHLELFEDTVCRLRNEQVKFIWHSSLAKTAMQFTGASLLALYLYVAIDLWHTALPELLTLVLVFGRLVPMFMFAQQSHHRLLYALPALQDIEALIVESARVQEPALSAQTAVCGLRDALVLDHVSVELGAVRVLSHLSLRLGARTTTAVIGASGAGKSSLADLLMGLLCPAEGTVCVDGIPLQGADRMHWRRNVAYVPQEVLLFHDSVRNNLLWGKPEASDDELKTVLEQAAAEFVFSLPDGLDTVLGDGGARLSGGERQRLALARALLKRPALLILDEATSALDVTNEMRVREAIERIHGDVTMLIIGHRLPTLEHADQVLVLEHGRIVANGNWAHVRAWYGDRVVGEGVGTASLGDRGLGPLHPRHPDGNSSGASDAGGR